MTQILLKRIYEEPESSDGYRVFLDRLWPQGIKKEDVHYDEWEKELTPSTQLREWYHADRTDRWQSFVQRYEAELKQNPDFVPFVKKIENYPVVTFLTASKDIAHSQLPIIKTMCDQLLSQK